MKRTLAVLVVALGALVLTGCTFPNGAIIAPITMTQSAVAVGDTSGGWTKTGEAMAEGIILLGKGDASISAAMEDGGITRIHHVDSEEFNVLGVYSTKKVIVYGN